MAQWLLTISEKYAAFRLPKQADSAPAVKAAPSEFRDAVRRQESVLAPLERRALVWMAERAPVWLNPDHLTLLGFVSMLAAGACYAGARWTPWALLAVNLCLALNWLGDSLDGTLARVRQRLRPRYGFYVDHMADAFGTLFVVAGLAASGYISERVAMALLAVYLILSIHVYLHTYTVGTFRLSFWKFSPTEARILLALGNVVALVTPRVMGGRWLFYDVAGILAGLVMTAVLIAAVAASTRRLYREERLEAKTGL